MRLARHEVGGKPEKLQIHVARLGTLYVYKTFICVHRYVVYMDESRKTKYAKIEIEVAVGKDYLELVQLLAEKRFFFEVTQYEVDQ